MVYKDKSLNNSEAKKISFAKEQENPWVTVNWDINQISTELAFNGKVASNLVTKLGTAEPDTWVTYSDFKLIWFFEVLGSCEPVFDDAVSDRYH